MRGTAIWIFIVTILVGLLMAREIRRGAFREVDQGYLDWLIVSASSKPELSEVTILEIDQVALQTGEPWPWSPLEYALFARAIQAGEPAVVTIDPVLDWEKPDPMLLDVLLEKLFELPKVVLTAELGPPEFGEGRRLMRPTIFRKVGGEKSEIPELPAVTAAPADDFQLAFSVGFEPSPDLIDQTVRKRVPLLYRLRGQVVPSVALQMLINAVRITAEEVEIELGSHIRLGSRYHIPIDEKGAFLLDWRMLEQQRRMAFDTLIEYSQESERSPEAAAKLRVMRDGVVILGRTDPAAATWQLAPERSGSLVDVRAATVAAVLQHHFIQSPPDWVDYALVLAIGFLAIAIFHFGRGATFTAFLVLVPIYCLTTLAIFERQLVWSPFSLPIFLLGAVVLVRLCWPGRLTRSVGAGNDGSGSLSEAATSPRDPSEGRSA